jgi:DNA-directed RNA polymerase subunit RPC12/RpoP
MSEKTKVCCPRCKVKFGLDQMPLTGDKIECPTCKHRFAPHEPKNEPPPLPYAYPEPIGNASRVDSEQGDGEQWIAPPITTGGGIMMAIGGLVMAIAGVQLAGIEPEYSYLSSSRIVTLPMLLSAIKSGSCFLGGLILFGFGFSQRLIKQTPK